MARALQLSNAKLFQSTPSAWRETCGAVQRSDRRAFQSTPSAWRETRGERGLCGTQLEISIHSLRMEGDLRHWNNFPPNTKFQSTPSAWRETPECRRQDQGNTISIHSLRMEGDSTHQSCSAGRTCHFNPLPPHGGRLHIDIDKAAEQLFQSTPSAWRETQRSFIKDVKLLVISIHSLRMEGDSKTAQESVFHFAYPCTILQKRMQKTTFCTRKNGFFRKKGEKFGAKPSASFCAPMIRTDTFPLNFSHRISGSSMSMVSFAPICSTFD